MSAPQTATNLFSGKFKIEDYSTTSTDGDVIWIS